VSEGWTIVDAMTEKKSIFGIWLLEDMTTTEKKTFMKVETLNTIVLEDPVQDYNINDPRNKFTFQLS